MARLNVWVPDELDAALRAQLPGINVSKLLQEAIRGVLGCRHEQLACRRCALPIDRHALLDERLGEFYRDLLWSLEPLVNRIGTAEGAARIAKDVALRFQVPGAEDLPLPRPSKANRERAKDLEFEYAKRCMEQSTTRQRRARRQL
jgi:post-segregation antitoxin (ccd killing protein)